MLSLLKTLGAPPRRQLLAQIQALETERDTLKAELANWRTWVPPGHFYSPIPNLDELRAREANVFAEPPTSLAGIDLRVEDQLRVVQALAAFYPEMPYPRTRGDDTRYWFENPFYSYADAIFLYGMLRYLQPRRVIEVGSGFSSAGMLDTDERFLGSSIDFTFVEPYTGQLDALLRPQDRERVRIIASPVQDVPLETFDALEANDILFIDSTHVAKIGSDVNRIVFDVLPRLRSGVHVHFHDVFYPFEYLKDWIYEGRAWNEDYILRAFLEFNNVYRVVLFGTYVARFHGQLLARTMPLALENPGGALWLRRE